MTLAFLALVLLCAWRGYGKGFIGALTPVLSLLAAYPAAFFLAKPLADFLAARTALQGPLLYLAAGGAIFLGVSLTVTLLLNWLGRLPEDEERSGVSQWSGACAGALLGIVIGLGAVYAYGLVRKPDASAVPSTADRMLQASAKRLIGAAVTFASTIMFDDPAAPRISRAFAEDPRAALGHVQEVMNSDEVAALVTNEQASALIASGDVDTLMRVPAFQQLVNDPHVQALLPTENGTTDTRATAETLVSAWSKIEKIRSNPEFVALLSDPKLTRQLQSRDPSLMTNPKLTRLMELIFAGEQTAAQ